MFPLLKLFKELNEDKATIREYGERTPEQEKLYDEYCKSGPFAISSRFLSGGHGAVHITASPKRPGDVKPTAYIDRTRELLSKAMDKHTDELLALDKDIEKLTEERRQCRIAIDGMQAALTHMSAVDASVVPPTQAEIDATTLAALKKLNLDDGAE